MATKQPTSSGLSGPGSPDSIPETHSLLADYEETVSDFEHVLELLASVDPAQRRHHRMSDPPEILRARSASKYLRNVLSLLIAWACDVQIECGYLDKHKNSIVGIVVRECLQDLAFQLEGISKRDKSGDIVPDLDRLSNMDFQQELLDSISSLQSQTKAIRMSQALDHCLGPLRNLVDDIELIGGRLKSQTSETVKSNITWPIRNIPTKAAEELRTEIVGKAIPKDLASQSHKNPVITKAIESFRSAQSAPQYVHVEIDPERELRLLVLHRGLAEDSLDCSILKAGARQRTQPYAALSHVWGRESPSQEIWVRNSVSYHGPRSFRNIVEHVIKNSKRLRARKLLIRPNLSSALKRLRKVDQDLCLWTDTLCINRDQPDELGLQVRHMANIYYGAEEVLAWLGEGNETSDLAFRLIKAKFDPISELSVKERNAMLEVLNNAWFTRLWNIQELALARRATIACGNSSISWANFVHYLTVFIKRFDTFDNSFGRPWEPNIYLSNCLTNMRHSQASAFLEVVNKLFTKNKSGDIVEVHLDLQSLVMMSTSFKVSDPRDTIYALLSVAKDTREQYIQRGSIEDIRPDYGKSYEELCIEFTLFCIQRSGSSDIICIPWALEGFQLPSWIPTRHLAPYDFSGSTKKYRINAGSLAGVHGRKYNTCGVFAGSIPFPGESLLLSAPPVKVREGTLQAVRSTDVIAYSPGPKLDQPLRHDIEISKIADMKQYDYLRIKGFKLDTVYEVSPRIAAGVVPLECLQLIGATKVPLPNETWQTLVANRDEKGQLPPSYYQEACNEALKRVNSNGDLDTNTILAADCPPRIHRFLERMQSVVWNRRFTVCSATGGKPAILPAETVPGDMIFVLVGCSVPVVLRPLGPRLYSLVGECYVHGIMEPPFDDFSHLAADL